jgi:hypothetical protein
LEKRRSRAKLLTWLVMQKTFREMGMTRGSKRASPETLLSRATRDSASR